jgi:hypothetical protein
MRTKAVLAAVLMLSVGAVGVSHAVIKTNKGALVMTWPGGQAETRANVIAAGAPTTLPDIDFLPVGSPEPNVPNGPHVHSEDTETNGGGTNSASAVARYNNILDGAPGACFVDLVVKGKAGGALGNSRDGFGVTAIGDTAIDMRFTARVTPTGGTSANLVLNGTALIQRTNPAGPGVGTLDIIVYPDTVTANLDVTNSGAGAVFKGRLIVDKDGIEKADGGWSASDFAVQLTTDRARITATGLTKAISCPNSALLATMVGTDASAQAVPASSPLALGILSLLMLVGGYMVLRRRAVEA